MNDPDGAEGLGILSRKVSGVEGMTLAAADVQRWLPVVGRFSFQPGLAEALS